MKKNKIFIILGTRPEIIKLSPLIRLFNDNRKKIDFFIIHTNQHYSKNLDQIFFEELGLPAPDFNLGIGSGDQGDQTGRMLIEIEKILKKNKPDIVLVQGDTNTVLAGALAAVKLKIKIGHIEAGLRSYDKNMPEETNRILTDHCSDFLFCPTELSKKNLSKENISKKKIFVVGNSIVDAVHHNKILAKRNSIILSALNLETKEYMLATSHRAENVDDKNRLKGIIEGLSRLHDFYKIDIIFPIHPRTRKNLDYFNIKIFNGLKLIDPVGYLDFLQLESKAKLIITDSGGVQEESCILKVPCITIRDTTERPETVEVGSNLLVNNDPKLMMSGAKFMLSKNRNWKNPFGDGTSSEKILDIIEKKIK